MTTKAWSIIDQLAQDKLQATRDTKQIICVSSATSIVRSNAVA